jgi:cyclase
MSVSVRVIPCLDVDAGRVVKGVNFENLRDAGDPVELARTYDAAGADELTFLDGVRTVEDVDRLLRAGADKVGVNTAAIARPELISEIADRFGSQVLVLSVDARRVRDGVETASGYEVTTHGGRQGTGIDAVEWAARAATLGAGEILLNSMDADGTYDGYDLEMFAQVRSEVRVPLIASGGASSPADFSAAAKAGADAVLAASVFHFGRLTIDQVKQAMAADGVPVRL